MTIITISRGSYSAGKDVAEKVADRLGFDCLSRDVLLEASNKFNIPEIKLIKAFINVPSVLDRFSNGQQKYIAYIQSALTRHVCQDSIVYHGLAGHVLLKNVSHVFKVCITASFERRVSILMKREQFSEKEAASWIAKVDKERRKWTQTLYNVNPWEPGLYDLLVNIDKYDVDDAVDLIYQSSRLKPFQTTDISQRIIEDLALAAEVKALLVEKFPDVKVKSKHADVVVYTKGGEHHRRKVRDGSKKLLSGIEGISSFEVVSNVPIPQNAV